LNITIIPQRTYVYQDVTPTEKMRQNYINNYVLDYAKINKFCLIFFGWCNYNFKLHLSNQEYKHDFNIVFNTYIYGAYFVSTNKIASNLVYIK
jgi:hypothetical protein